ncbi:MAG: ankyrin repeat domain-containing protein, partial [Acidobacteria bacterium]|nr:ankyrin repeat domain-containing protein [Acidobacteriota bacterium]
MSERIGFPILAALLIASCSGGQDLDSSNFLAAVSDGQTETVQSLLSAGAAVNETDEEGMTPLMHAVLKDHP